MPADRQFLPSIKHLLLREEDNVHPWSAARHQHIVTDYEPLDPDLSLNSAGFYKPMMKDSHQPPISRHSPLLDLQISPSTTPISSPISTWSPPSSDSGDPSHNVAQNVWGSTVTDQQQQQPPPHSAANKKHCRSFSEASQLQDLNVYHRRLSDGERRSASMSEVKNGISPKSSTTQKHQTSEEDALDTSPLLPPPHENQIIIFGTKTSQNSTSQASSGHRYARNPTRALILRVVGASVFAVT
ncbi:hypothetical protein Unana1_06050 [Umbelopsis nana]